MLQTKTRVWAEVSLDQIACNYRAMLSCLHPGCQIIAVLKANGYGHGAVAVARLLQNIGCRQFAVACMEEGIELRQAGIDGTVLLLSPVLPDWMPYAAEYRLTVPLTDLQMAQKLSEWASANGREVPAYLMADCGLSRFGVVVAGREEAAIQELCAMSRLAGLRLHSLMTHLTAGGVAEQDTLNREQLERFRWLALELEQRGVYLPKHCCASRFAVRYPDYQFDYVRVGSDLFGVHPYYGEGPVFLPAMELKGLLSQVKEVETGNFVGYGPVFKTCRRTKVAVFPMGYVDGLSCRLGGRMQMLVDGKRVQQIGRLCMDSCMLDVTDVPGAKAGDTVTVFGQDGGTSISVQEQAALYPGTASELICLLGRRVPRFYTGEYAKQILL